MDSDIARIIGNPYASPTTPSEAPPQPVEQPKPQQGSIGLIIAGLVLLLGGYFTSNLFVIGDLYGIGFGPRGQQVPSPLAAVFTTPAQLWLAYFLSASATAAGCVLFGSQRFHSAMAVVFFMCPIATVVFAVGFPLRAAQRFAVPIAIVYLAVGTCLAGAGIMRLVSLYGHTIDDFAPFIASMLTEAGLALFAGGLLKLWTSGAFSSGVLASAQGDFASARS